jgi:exonuclease VII small subunit
MAQPLPHADFDKTAVQQADYDPSNGHANEIDASAARLEQAFRRLESAVAHTGTGYASLKADKEKLNHLLHESEREAVKMREAVKHVSSRLDHTIATLEALEQ